ncbi:MAG: hypothetical protein KDD04_06655, partial [Sinomicrobium sp.]|nr:hypothetical protein [Sinomicrobium sp.]
MTKTTHYIIRKQVLDIRDGKQGNPYMRQAEISERYTKEVLPQLEKICHELCSGDQVIKIDTLIIDLPPMGRKSYHTAWVEEITKMFRKELSQAIAQAGESREQNVIAISPVESDLQLLRTFLYTGNLPWSYTEKQGRPPEVILRELIANEPAAVRQLIIAGLKQDTFARRLCYQFPGPILMEMFPLLQPNNAENIKKAYNALYHGLKGAGYFSDHNDAGFLIHYHSLQALAERSRWSQKQFTGRVLRRMAQAWQIGYSELLYKIFQTVKQTMVQGEMISFLSSLEALQKEAETASKAREVKTTTQEEVPDSASSLGLAVEEYREKKTASLLFYKELEALLEEAKRIARATGKEKT